MIKLKYIRTEYTFVIWGGDTITHREASRGLGDQTPISAGFCSIKVNQSDRAPYTVECYGESVSLGLKSRLDDGQWITDKIHSY